MKSKKLVVLLIISLFLFTNRVNAQSFDMILNTTNLEVEKDSVVEIYITLDNFNEIPDGINACQFDLDYDNNKIIINTMDGQNNWIVTQGDRIIVDTSSSTKTKKNIVKMEAKILDESIISIKNIQCSDGTNDISANNSILNLSVKESELHNNSYDSSNTVETEQLGIKELTIIFLLIALITLFIKKVIVKKELFKKI